MSNHSSMDFLGQKRRVRPVRRAQVSTHFDELNLVSNEGSTTPDPPGVDDSIIKELNITNEFIGFNDSSSGLQPRQAAYAKKIPSPPMEINTLVPEDFDFIDFNFKDSKSKNTPVHDEFIKTDNSFALPGIAEEGELEEETKYKSNTDDIIAESATAAIATTAAIVAVTSISDSSKEETQIAERKSTIIEEPLQKVSDARKSIESSNLQSSNPPQLKAAPIIIAEVPKVKDVNTVSKTIEEVRAPPPLPTNLDHLNTAKDYQKPTSLPVQVVNGAPSTSPLRASGINADELERLNKELEKQKMELEREIALKKTLEDQIQAMIVKSNAQDDTLRLKNESIDKLNSDYLKIQNDLLAVKTEKESVAASLAKAQQELESTGDSNAKAYLQKSDEVAALKDQMAEFTSIIGEKNKEIESLQGKLERVNHENEKFVSENTREFEKIEDDLMKAVEEEIMKIQDVIDEQREYNSKLQIEVDSEYAYWKKRLAARSEK